MSPYLIAMGGGVIGAIFAVIVVVAQVSKQKQDAVWKQLASELGAEFIESGFHRTGKVKAHFKDWTITLDILSISSGDSSEKYTQLTAPFQNKDGLQFRLSKKGLVSKLDKALGAKDIETGDPDFDRDL